MALENLEACLRDFRTGDRHPVDPRLYGLPTSLASSLGEPDGEFHFLSGFRSPWTTEMLRTTRRGGVGCYVSSDFVHVDTGRVRRW